MIFYITNITDLNLKLSDLNGDFTIVLEGEFTKINISQKFLKPVTFILDRAKIKGLTVSGSNVNFIGGSIEAPGGADGFARAGYGVDFSRCSDVKLIGAQIRNSKKGVVVGNCNNLTISNCDFSVREDGIIASQGSNYQFSNNYFHDFYPQPTTCQLTDEVRYRLSKKDCEALGGAWKDGDHSDAIQIRNGIKNMVISGNRINGISQGIGQMEATTDLPLENVIVINNDVRVTGFHSITITSCPGLQVIGNTTQQLTGRRSPLRLDPTAIVRDNNVLSP